jgi:UDPglucose 6-dehydrogenase
LAEKDLNLSARTDLKTALMGADHLIVSTPTDYDELTNSFDTESVETSISQVIEIEPNVCIAIKLAIPVGFMGRVSGRLGMEDIVWREQAKHQYSLS